MVKKGCVKCDKCGKMVSKKGIAAHKCDTLKKNDLIVCMICKTKLKGVSFKAHVPSCEARNLFSKHRSFFKFLLRLTRYLNRSFEAKEAKERKRAAFDQIYTLFENDQKYLKENGKELVEVAIDDMRRKSDIEALRDATKEGIVISKSLPIKVIKDIYKNLQPRISARQVIFKYLEDIGKFNKYIKYWINNCLKGKDYMTDEELAKDNIAYTKLQRLRVYSGYKETFSPFYDMLRTHFAKEEAYICPFCGKFFLKTRDHANKCKTFRNNFDNDKDGMIRSFLKEFYPQYIKDKDIEDYFLDYYRQYTASYFIATIDSHMKNRIEFREKIFKAKQSVLAPKNLCTTKDLIKEVDDWKPQLVIVKRSFESEEPVYSPLISEKEDNNDNEEEEEEIVSEKPIEDKNYEVGKGFYKFKKLPLPKDYKSEGEEEEEDSETLKQEKKDMKEYFKDINNHFDPNKEPKDDGEYSDLLDLDKL